MGKLSRLKTQGQRNRTSKGEKDLFGILKQMYPLATFWTEYPLSRIIEDCNNDKLRVDIYCSTFGIIWEYDGSFHFDSIPFSSEEEDVFAAKKALEEQKQRDSYKDRLCKDAGIKLVRIPYFEWDELKTDEEKKKYLMDKL
jgi:hypothetical protein